MDYDIRQMLRSGFERYVLIVETVRASDSFLSGADRMQLINDLLEQDKNYSIEDVEAECERVAEVNLGTNMIAAQLNREHSRGY